MKHRFSSHGIWALGMALILCTWILAHAYVQTQNNFVIYVWNFSTRDSEQDELTTNLTQEFEEALIQSKRFQVLERRKYDRLLAQKDNEKAILNIEGISSTALKNLKANQANAVVFGEMHDDIQSGQIKVTVTIQTFDGKKLDMQSIRFTRGKRFNPESRELAMKELVNLIFSKGVISDKELEKARKQVDAAAEEVTLFSPQRVWNAHQLIQDVLSNKDIAKSDPEVVAKAHRIMAAVYFAANTCAAPPQKEIDYDVHKWGKDGWIKAAKEIEKSLSLNAKQPDASELKWAERELRQGTENGNLNLTTFNKLTGVLITSIKKSSSKR